MWSIQTPGLLQTINTKEMKKDKDIDITITPVPDGMSVDEDGTLYQDYIMRVDIVALHNKAPEFTNMTIIPQDNEKD